ncbi:MAG: hypothetical protein ABIP74_04565 [Candidatus Saccharimonas sp.]
MCTNHTRSKLAIVGLILALGILLVSIRRFVLYSGIYDMKLVLPASNVDWAIEFVTFCLYSACLLVAYALLKVKRQTDAPLAEFCFMMFLILGGLLGIMGVMFGGWMMGLNNFFFGGMAAIVCGALVGFVCRFVIYTGGKLDNLIQHLAYKE